MHFPDIIGFRKHGIVALIMICTIACSAYGQMSESATGEQATENERDHETAETAPKHDEDYPAFFRLDYSGDFWSSPALTGDWDGKRTELANDGISFQLEVLQVMQGNASGGRRTGVEYFGSADFVLEFDTYRMGLWPGGFVRLRGEVPWGRNANSLVGAVLNPNFDALFPEPNNPGLTTLTEAWMMQAFSEKLFMLAGKLDLTRLPGQNVFAGDYYTQFMNTALWQNPVMFATIPYSMLGVGVGYKPTEWFDGMTVVLDSYGSPTRSGFDTAFGSPNGMTIAQALNFHYKIGELPGNSRFLASWSSRNRTSFDDFGRLALSSAISPTLSATDAVASARLGRARPLRFLSRAIIGRLLKSESHSNDYMISYDFDQFIYQEPDDPTQGIGVFGRFGWSPGKVNPIQAFYSGGIGGTGIIPNRDRDRFGLGYYYIDFSGDLPRLLGISHEHGVELFYNIEVTPWLHITPDLQVVFNPGGVDERDTAVVYGLRAHMSF